MYLYKVLRDTRVMPGEPTPDLCCFSFPFLVYKSLFSSISHPYIINLEIQSYLASSSRLVARRPPLRGAEARESLELAVAELDVGGANHARFEAQSGA
jgi:hypothetical protein